VATLAVASLTALTAGPAAAPAATPASVGNPSAGRVEAVSIKIQGHFTGKKAPLVIPLSLPSADQPAGLEILAQDRRTKVAGHLATYLLQVEVLNPKSTGSPTTAGGGWGARLIALFNKHFTRHATSKVLVTEDLFGSSPSALSTLAGKMRSLAAPTALNALETPTWIDNGGLGLTSAQLGELNTFWGEVWGFLNQGQVTAGGLATLFNDLDANFPGLFDGPSGSTSATPTYGSTLTEDPTAVAEGNVDFVLWQIGQPIPVSGQVTSISVRGYYAGGSCGMVCETNLHFQDLRPTAGGQLQVIVTSEPFTLPSTLGTYTFALSAFKFRVQAGDYIGLATSGGAWEVLAPASGDQVAQFTGYNGDMNGDSFASNLTVPDSQVNMQVTVQPNAS
jgi:hypothetical protein